MTINEFNEIALSEMFKTVGLKYETGIIDSFGWHSQRHWTDNQEQQFMNWYKDNIMLNEVVDDRDVANTECLLFILKYGWQTI